LPNLTIKDSIESEFIAITNEKDERIKAIAQTNSIAKHLMSSFEDERGRAANPSFLIIRDESIKPESLDSAAVSFRNIISLCSIYYGWRHKINTDDPNVFVTLFSDFYDFYPISRIYEEYFVISSSALNGIESIENFTAQRSPRLPRTTYFNFHFNKHLFNSLMKLWKTKFVTGNSGVHINSIFRSLEMVYSACKMPDNNLSTIHDYGMHLGLWVSAFEILFHPGGKSHIGFKDVSRKLQSHIFSDQRLNEKKYDLTKSEKTNISGKLYKEIYDSRNAFFHGNEVGIEYLFPFKNEELPSLLKLAPVLFTFGLMLYLEEEFSLIDPEESKFDHSIELMLNTLGIENTLLKFAV